MTGGSAPTALCWKSAIEECAMKSVLAIIFAMLLGVTHVALAQPSQASAPAAVKNRVVMQVSDADAAKWNLALNNARNIQSDLGRDNVDIEIVVYGPGGIGMLKRDSPVGSRIDEAMTSGVNVVAC